MKPGDALAEFVQQGIAAGHSPERLRAALGDAGWTGPEIDTALAGWADAGLGVPVPVPLKRSRTAISAREALVYALLFVAVLFVTWNLVSFGFLLIEEWVPDRAARGRRGIEASTSAMRWHMATLIVLGPLFLWLHLQAQRAEAAQSGLRRSVFRNRVGGVGMFLAVLVLLGNAVVVVHAGLNGDLTAQFMAKAALVAAVAAMVLGYFRRFMGDG